MRSPPGAPGLALLAALALAGPGLAQQTGETGATAAPAGSEETEPPSVLVADRVEIQGDARLVASGNVEVVQGDTRMTASRIIYDDATGSLTIEGPITVIQGETSVLLASSGELDTGFQDGILRSARLVLDQQLQLAAVEIARVSGRYSQLSKVTASSCEVCAKRPVPLWQIRSRRVIHDELERQLYFDGARLEVLGLPVAYIPRLRLPDPTLERATGFLVPSIRTTDELGEGIKVPYFFVLGDNRDLTLTPYLATNRTQTLEARYRQAFRTGEIQIDAAVSDDDIVQDELRGYLFADAEFRLPRDYRLAFDIETTSDDSYLLDYDYSDKDRLDSAISLTRAGRDEFINAEAIGFRSLRVSEDNETQPFLLTDVVWLRRFRPSWVPGTVSFELASHTHERRSNEDVIGRDVGRLTGQLDWRVDDVGPAGILLAAQGRLFTEYSFISQDSNFPDPVSRIVPTAAVELRWPWVRPASGRGGASHIIEPVAQVVWAPGDAADPDTPADESTQIELDEGNLFALSRFPATDRTEAGLRVNMGINYTRFDPAGWSMGVTVGRVYRNEDQGQFDGITALDGVRSDWLAALTFSLGERLSLTNRALFDEDFVYDKFETRLGWRSEDIELAGTYTWLEESPAEMRDDAINEWRLDGVWQVNDSWRASTEWRYDLTLDRSASARLGLEFRTECVTVTTSVRRRFTSSEQLRPTTNLDFEVALAGFGGTGENRPRPRRRGCVR
ncbi:MAG: LPS assembly protein LptD [Pseudomonadota bacterium]